MSRSDSLGLSQAGLQMDFWQLDKKQHASGTFETGSYLTKGDISLASGRSAYDSPWMYSCSCLSKLEVPTVPIHKYTFLRPHTNILALLASSGFPPPRYSSVLYIKDFPPASPS